MKFYAGVGSRETPAEVLKEMTCIAGRLRERGYILRSGGADGADTAFEQGAGDAKRIYLPWNGFNRRYRAENVLDIGHDKGLAAIAARHHPAWWRLSDAARKLHTRNVAQVLGYTPEDHTDSAFVVCWTPGGGGGGGTGQAIRIAEFYRVPVYDLADAASRVWFYEKHLD